MNGLLKHITTLFIFCICLILGNTELYAQTGSSAQQLQPTHIWKLEDTILYNPSKIEISGDYLIVSDAFKKGQIVIFNRKYREYIQRMARAGRGPSEFLHIWNMMGTENASVFCIADMNLRKVTCFDILKVIKQDKEDIKPVSITLLDKSFGIPINVNGWPEEDRFILGGIFPDESRLLVVDKDGTIQNKVGSIFKLPQLKQKFPLNVLHNAYVANIAVGPNGKVALASRLSNIIELYTTDGKLLKMIKGPGEFFKPNIKLSFTPPKDSIYVSNGRYKDCK